MDIKLTEIIRGATVSLVVEDAPMTSIKALVACFITACTEVEGQQLATGMVVREVSEWPVLDDAGGGPEFYEAAPVVPGHPDYRETVEVVEEAPAKRKRRTKAEMAADAAAEATAEDKEPGNGTETPTADANSDTSDVGAKSEDSTSGPSTTGTTTSTSSTATTDASPSDAEPVTDTELQRYCARVAQHFGNPQKVFELAGRFVPEGAVARPTNIIGNPQRLAFIAASEEASGVKYHG